MKTILLIKHPIYQLFTKIGEFLNTDYGCVIFLIVFFGTIRWWLPWLVNMREKAIDSRIEMHNDHILHEIKLTNDLYSEAINNVNMMDCDIEFKKSQTRNYINMREKQISKLNKRIINN